MNAAPLLQVDQVSKRFGGVQALSGVSLSLCAGELHALMGENGAGKSTLIKVIVGVHAPDGGALHWKGQPIRITSPLEAQRLGISVIHQESTMIADLSVTQNFALGREPVRAAGWVDWRAARAELLETADQLGVSIDPDARAGDLTVAQRKIVEICKAVSQAADLIIMDEPTAALTASDVAVLMQLIGRLKAAGKAILYVSHRMAEVRALADQITVLKDGQLVGTRPAADVTTDQIVAMMVGRELGQIYPSPPEQPPGAPALEVKGFSLPGAFSAVNLTVRSGEIVTIAGLQGQGQRQLAQALYGALPARAGQVRVHGVPVRLRSPQEAIRHGIGFTSDDRQGEALVPILSVRENIALASLRLRQRFGFVQEPAEASLVQRLVNELRIKTASPEAAVNTLSGGNQQKVVLARWLADQIKVLILLEPTAGVDVGARAEIYRLLRDLTARGVGILVVTSDLPEALGLSDRILVMYRGRLQAEFERAAFSEAAVMTAATGQSGKGGSQP
ncbi:MAG TPA: sugar ABC transporter ATP-binding protein [Symbiobacteriaceae bacterium]|nr:sugar ABC transporter ATP-binding protein [Symbiobacteriaceae bacterium]